MADMFEEIAMQRIGARRAELVKPAPISYEKNVCELKESSSEPRKTAKKMDTKEELYSELDAMRKKYAKYLMNHAPSLDAYSTQIPIKDFVLNGSEKITIPHYGAPLGNATEVYESEFEMESYENKAVYICFKGADYIAEVFINDTFAGMHEGFFAPFEFEITNMVKKGKNTLKVILKNDFIYGGNIRDRETDNERREGDKLYAATGPGYDDAKMGWHHCPAGMGIYNSVYVDIRNKINITDLYVRPDLENGRAELWAEIENAEYEKKNLVFDLSLYGQNFKQTVFENVKNEPIFVGYEIPAQHGKNIYKMDISIPDAKVWEPDAPNLYQLQVKVFSEGELSDTGKVTFGMRSFVQDTESSPKGMFYLNGKKIRLRGANTMGFEQQDVMNGDFNQLIDDILLAKICNMNFWRLTQRPVQDEVYQYCDMLGLMTQTDLPLFGIMRRNKFCEGVRQAEEMIRIVRKHPCNVVVTYINEPHDIETPRYRPHRHLLRAELEEFFKACDIAVKLNAPDCVIKHIDGDYTPPDHNDENCMPDNHTYTLWYNGHEIELGELYRGYWVDVKPDWYYGCGEFGAEGLDFVDLMKRRYPKEWLKEPFDVGNILCAQSKNSHGRFFDTPETLEEWVEKTQAHQAFAASIMTESFRRDPRMVSFAIHLFIDAWPSGWMKTIMDCERTPKPAYFAYKNALEPILVSLRCDRFTYYENETVSIEAYVCNDTIAASDAHHKMVFELYDGDKMIMSREIQAKFDASTTSYIANAEFKAMEVDDRKTFTLKAILMHDDEVCDYNSFEFDVFAKRHIEKSENVVIITDLEVGEHEIAGERVVVKDATKSCGYLNFVSRKTNHSAVREFREKDFFMWYNKEKDMITPITNKEFFADGFDAILLSDGAYSKGMAAGVKEYQGKKYVISLLDLRTENPVAERFLENISALD